MLIAFVWEAVDAAVFKKRVDFSALIRVIVVAGFIFFIATYGAHLVQSLYVPRFTEWVIQRLSTRVHIYECVANRYLGIGLALLLAGAAASILYTVARLLARLKLQLAASALGSALTSLGRAMIWFFVFLIITVGGSYIVALFGLQVVLELLLDPRLWISVALVGLSLSLIPPLRGFGASLFASALVLLIGVPLMCFAAEKALDMIAAIGVEGVSAHSYNLMIVEFARRYLGIYVPPSGVCKAISLSSLASLKALEGLFLYPGRYYVSVIELTALCFTVPAFIYGFFLGLAGLVAVGVSRAIAGSEAVQEAVSGILRFVR